MTSFAQLKKNRANQLDKLAGKSKKANDGGFEKDVRLWSPTRVAGNALAVIRFLPSVAGEDDPWVRYWEHSFQNKRTQQWYIEKSLTTLGQKDPVAEYNSTLWAKGDKDGARKQKRKLRYVSNILVIDDKQAPENNGQVRILRYGKQIFEKVTDAMNPKFDDVEAFNPFDLWTGANFRMEVYTSDRYPKYDKCAFASPAALYEDESEMEAVWQKCHALQPFCTEGFKSYDELKAKFDRVMGFGMGQTAASQPHEDESHAEPRDAEPAPQSADEEPPFEPATVEPEVAALDDGEGFSTSEDEDADFFNTLREKARAA